MRTILRAALAWLVLLGFTIPAGATPANKLALTEYLGPLAPAKSFDCRTCHVGKQPSAEDHEHNSFGERLVTVRKQLKQAGKPNDLPSRLTSIADEDSDGDGASNLDELLTGHSPGDATDKLTADDLKSVDAKRTEFQKHQSAYRWQPLVKVNRPPVPALGEAHPIDAFLKAARLDAKVRARPEASRATLLRRVTFDLIGLPPTVAEMDAFLADASADAYDKVVDRLLASPRYGERWGRHWMDVWRYSDWAGYGAEVRESLPHIWQWRDWIIESINADKGYDRMVREMLAGDELAPTDPATLRATGFLARNSYIFNRNVVLENTVEHTGKAFLGLTINCARCHDHLYDPISQAEYYSFRAIFEPCLSRTDRVPGQPDVKTLGLPRIYDATPAAKTNLLIRGNEATPDPNQVCPPAVPVSLGGAPFSIEPLSLPLEAVRPSMRSFEIAEARTAARQHNTKSQDGARAALSSVVRSNVTLLGLHPIWSVLAIPTVQGKARDLELAGVEFQFAQAKFAALEAILTAELFDIAKTLGTPEGQRVAELAVIAQRQEAVARAQRDLLAAEIANERAVGKAQSTTRVKVATTQTALAKATADASSPLHEKFTRRGATNYPEFSSGRRLALARWITDRQNPLAARVAVNHIWSRHFGQAIVPTMFDFGRNGQRATHPALLDWLAVEFMERGWSMKHLHRLIVTSHAYKLDSRHDATNAARDPENKWLWRMTARRMEAEVVRDSVIAITGQIDLTTGGPELDQNQSLSTYRRSLYYRHANEKQSPFLMIFDAASANECYQRASSIVPQQALALANSPLTRSASQVLAKKLHEQIGPPDAAFVRAAFRQVLNRPPTVDELRECTAFVARGEPLRARTSLVHVLFNHHDFVTIH